MKLRQTIEYFSSLDYLCFSLHTSLINSSFLIGFFLLGRLKFWTSVCGCGWSSLSERETQKKMSGVSLTNYFHINFVQFFLCMKFFSNTFSAKKLWGCVGGKNKRDQFAWKIEKSYILFWLRLRWFEGGQQNNFFSGKIHFFFGTISENFFFSLSQTSTTNFFQYIKDRPSCDTAENRKIFRHRRNKQFSFKFCVSGECATGQWTIFV